MSVKTEAIKPVAEISLFDAFGPNVGEQVQAINQRAAELSMGDMALVMGVKESVKQKPALLAEHDDGVDFNDTLSAWFDSKAFRTDATFQISPPCNLGLMVSPPQFGKDFPLPGAIARSYFPVLRTCQQGIQDVMGAVSSKLHHLQGVGVDESKITVSIRYKDPKTGAFRSESLDAESGINARALVTPKPRTRKTRKVGREVVMHYLASKK